MKLLVIASLAALAVAPPPSAADPTIRADARAVLMVGFEGATLDPGTLFHLRDGGRGVIVLGPNVADTASLRTVSRQVSCATGGAYLLAVDHEPGRVQRLSPLIGTFPRSASDSDLHEASIELGSDLRGLGVTMNLAPVLDLDGSSPALRGRTLGSEPDTVSSLGEAFRTGVESTRVVSVVKHFPGHGRAPQDPHVAMTTVEGSIDADLAPFRDAVASGTRAVMVGHPVYTELDPDNPASSSPAAYDLLRSWGFEGVALTDALGMVGARNDRTVPETAIAAVAAGADLLIIEDPGLREDVVDAIVAAVADGTIDRDSLAESARRVRRLAAWTAGYRTDCGSVWVRE